MQQGKVDYFTPEGAKTHEEGASHTDFLYDAPPLSPAVLEPLLYVCLAPSGAPRYRRIEW
jgi:hypothetical protein